MTKNNLTNLLNSEKQNILNIYFTAGFPELESTRKIINALENTGADIIELGIPYSDPLADGPVIQASNQKALNNGMSLAKLFDQLKGFRKESKIPVLLMGYLNSIINFGLEKFCKSCFNCGIDGVILPDMPLNIYKNEYKDAFEKSNLSVVFLITPQTSDERIKEFDEASTAFVYAISSSSTTGTKNNIDESEYFLKRIQNMNLKNTVLTGFNIKNALSFKKACNYTRGGIIGSAFIKAIEHSNNLEKDIKSFIEEIRS